MEQIHWPTIIIFAICLVAGGLAAAADAAVFSAAASEIVTFSSLMSAGAMSAVVLVPTLMAHRFNDAAVRQNVREFADYHGALWMGAFGVAALLAVLVIFGEVVGWKLNVSLSSKNIEQTFNCAHVLNGAIGFLFAYLVFRIFFLAGAIQDLLRSIFDGGSSPAPSSTVEVDEPDLPVDEDHGRIVEYGKDQ